MYGVLVFVVLSMLTLQNAQSKEIILQTEPANLLHEERSSKNFRESRQLKDVFKTIQNSAKKLWDSIRMMTINSKEKIKTWFQNVKKKAKDVMKHFEGRVKQIREKGKKVIAEIVGTGHLVKACIKKDSTLIQQILKQIIEDASACISENLKHMSDLIKTKEMNTIIYNNNYMEKCTYEINDINGTKLIGEIDTSLNDCLENEHTDAETCMHEVRLTLFGKMEDMESDVLKHRNESRSMLDDLLDSLMNCSVDGLLEASNVIAEETFHVMACVMNEKNGRDIILRTWQ